MSSNFVYPPDLPFALVSRPFRSVSWSPGQRCLQHTHLHTHTPWEMGLVVVVVVLDEVKFDTPFYGVQFLAVRINAVTQANQATADCLILLVKHTNPLLID